MGSKLRWILAFVLAAALIAYAFTYTVRFTEAAVLTSFGKAGEGAVKTEPGLYFKLPYPVQSVTHYDTRCRLLQTKLETATTADDRQVIVETFCTWRVSDPLKFFQNFSNAGDAAESHYKNAEQGTLTTALRAAAMAVSSYRLGELFGTGREGSKLPDLEKRMKLAFETTSDETGRKMADYGIEAVDVGITRVVLPAEITRAVFQRMQAGRDRLTQETESQGESRAQEIKSKADADAEKIRAFAKRLAEQIRNQGDLEASKYMAQMASNPELAVFLSNMQFIKDAYGTKTTMVFSSQLPGVWMLFPDALSRVKPGEIPQPTAPPPAQPPRRDAATPPQASSPQQQEAHK